MKRNLSVLFGALCTALLLLPAHRALAQANAKPPTQLTYQGFLTDGSGVPFGNTAPVNKTIIFRIYDALTGGTLIWSSQQVITVDKGYFSALLGQGSAVGNEPFTADLTSVFAGSSTASDRYLALTADGTTIAPRLRFLPAPYAVLAKSATELLDPLTGSSSLSIANGIINGSGAGLTSLNANNIASGTLADGRLTSNIPLKNAANTFAPGLQVSGIYNSPTFLSLSQSGPTWGSAALHDAFRYITTSSGAADGFKQFNVGAGGVSIGYANVPAYDNGGQNDALYVNGNVGIGTTRPALKLSVDVGNGDGLRITGPGGGGTTVVLDLSTYQPTSGKDPTARIEAKDDGAASSSIDFQTKNPGAKDNSLSSRMFVSSSGNVGIGTTSPGAKLDVKGDIHAWGGVMPASTWSIYDDGTGKLIFQKAGGGYFYIEQSGNYNRSSDRRLKKDIAPLGSNSLDKILRLSPVSYRFRTEPEGAPKSIGFIAQEVQELFPDLVSSMADGNLGLSYSGFGVLAIAAIQELKAEQDRENAALVKENAALKEQMTSVLQRLQALESRVK